MFAPDDPLKGVRKLFPDLPDDKLQEVKDFFDDYLSIAWRIYVLTSNLEEASEEAIGSVQTGSYRGRSCRLIDLLHHTNFRECSKDTEKCL
jgi:hypothetical protein